MLPSALFTTHLSRPLRYIALGKIKLPPTFMVIGHVSMNAALLFNVQHIIPCVVVVHHPIGLHAGQKETDQTGDCAAML